jgi:chemotaxis protein CheZ
VRLSKSGSRGSKEAASVEPTSRGFGPAIPGVDHGPAVSGQQDVDALLSGLGM